jgi:hypothetical protein
VRELLWDGFWPRRTQCAGRFGAQPLAVGPQDQAGAREMAMGLIDVWAGYKVLNNIVYDYLPSFRSLFDEFLYSF